MNSLERPRRHRAARILVAGACVLSLGVWAVPAAAQSTSSSGAGAASSSGSSGTGAARAARGWRAGPDASGSSTYVGRIDAVRAGAESNAPSVSARNPAPFGGTVRVTGWAVDTTATGWAGFDDVQVFQGTADKGTLLAKGSVGQARADIEDAFGKTDFRNSGFYVDVPLTGVETGQQSLNLYLHTPSKGWWYRAFNVWQKPDPKSLTFTNEPTIFFNDPPETDDANLAKRVSVSKDYLRANGIKGWNVAFVAMDQNLQVDNSDPAKQCAWGGFQGNPKNATFQVGSAASPQNCGIDRTQVYLDGPRGEGKLVGSASAGNLLPSPKTQNVRCKGANSEGVKGSTYASCPGWNGANPGGNYTPVAAGYGTQWWGAGWQTSSIPIEEVTGTTDNDFQPQLHTVYAYARSAITGAEHMTSTMFWVVP